MRSVDKKPFLFVKVDNFDNVQKYPNINVLMTDLTLYLNHDRIFMTRTLHIARDSFYDLMYDKVFLLTTL